MKNGLKPWPPLDYQVKGCVKSDGEQILVLDSSACIHIKCPNSVKLLPRDRLFPCGTSLHFLLLQKGTVEQSERHPAQGSGGKQRGRREWVGRNAGDDLS